MTGLQNKMPEATAEDAMIAKKVAAKIVARIAAKV